MPACLLDNVLDIVEHVFAADHVLQIPNTANLCRISMPQRGRYLQEHEHSRSDDFPRGGDTVYPPPCHATQEVRHPRRAFLTSASIPVAS